MRRFLLRNLAPGKHGFNRASARGRRNRYYIREQARHVCWSASMDFGTTLIFSILFGSIGMGYFVYGKKQQAAIPLIAGIVLCIFPYFVSNVYIMVLVGIVLTVLPWVI
jgi:hypothetical protein